MRPITALTVTMCLLVTACTMEAPESLKVEMRTEPEGISADSPRFSWINQTRQDAYKLKIAKRGVSGAFFRSGWQESTQSVLVPYSGPELASDTDYNWKVKVRSGHKCSAWSKTAHFSTGLNDSTEWAGAEWIGVDQQVGDNEQHLPARYLRNEIILRKRPVRAKMYFCGLGMGKVTVNGASVSPDIFAHPPVLFDKVLYYRTYDVTKLLQKGANSIGVVLGCGRYQTLHVWTLRCVTDPRMLLCLKVTYSDGSEESFVSNSGWMSTVEGPITCQNEFDGEHYDARKELGAWDKTGYSCGAEWKAADRMEAPKGEILPMPMEDMAVQDHIRAVKVRDMGEGRYIADLGQNMVGYVKVRLQASKDVPVVFRFGEHLNAAADSVDLSNLRAAEGTDSYIPSADGEFSWAPLFPYHGFRYVEISGLKAAPAPEDIEGQVIYDRMETTGSFECSDERLNQLYRNMYCGIRSNYRGIPTDCPQRDERQGWLGDRGATVWSEPYVFDCAALYRKWMKDIVDSMHKKGRISVVTPKNWTIYNDDMAASVVFLYIAEMLYTRFGDADAISIYYPAMKKWFDQVTGKNLHDGIFTMKFDEYRDWCVPPESPELIHSKDPSRLTSSEVIQTGILCDALKYMIRFAGLTGNDADVPAYKAMLEEVKEAYNERFFNSGTASYDNNTVTANLIPLAMGIVPEDRVQDVAATVVDVIENVYGGHVASGNVGIRYLMQTLTKTGYKELAYRLATQDSYPGWGYMISKGATTVWELWNGDTADIAMNSENHVMMIGDLLAWYYEDLAGIKCDPDAVAFDKVLMQPCFPEGLDWVKASHKTPYGIIRSEWSRSNGSFRWDISIPSGCSATVKIPASFRVDTSGYTTSTCEDATWCCDPAGAVILHLDSGEYSFTRGTK